MVILVRSTCLKLLSLITINLSGHVGVPRQLVITGDAASIPGSVAKAGLRLPLGTFSTATCTWTWYWLLSMVHTCYGGENRITVYVAHCLRFFFLLQCNNGSDQEAQSSDYSHLTLCAVAKPLVADGTAKSHAMSLAYDKYCLTELDPPLVLQEFVNHGTSYALSPFCLTAFYTFQVENYMASCRYMPLPLAPFSVHMFWLIRELCFLIMLEHRSHMQLSLVKLKICMWSKLGLGPKDAGFALWEKSTKRYSSQSTLEANICLWLQVESCSRSTLLETRLGLCADFPCQMCRKGRITAVV